MKKIYTLLLFAFAVQFSQAQNPQLFDREWKLFQLVVDGEYVPVPVDDVDLSDVNLTFTPANASSLPQLNTRICNQGVGYPDFSIAENAFFMDAFGVTLISCIDPGNNDLDNAFAWFLSTKCTGRF